VHRQLSCAAFLAAIAVGLIGGRAASAQEPRSEASIQYGWLDDDGFHLPVGWVASAATYFAPNVALVGEVGGQYDFERVPNLPEFTYANMRYNINLHTFAGGARITTSRTSAFSVFGQFLIGTQRIAGDPLAPFDWSQWSLMLQPGGGVTIRVARRVAIRATLDLPIIRAEVFAPTGMLDVFGDFGYAYQYEYRRMTRLGAGLAFGF